MFIELPFLIYSTFVVFFAGIVRGYSGFGASMIIVISLSLVMPVAEIVPALLLLEILASLYLIPGIRKKIHWSSLNRLLVGILLGTPFGVIFLTGSKDNITRIFVSIIVMGLIPLLWKGFQLTSLPGKSTTVLVGSVSGFLNGVAAIGGPPVVLFYFSSPSGVEVSRATLIAFFLFTDLYAAVLCTINGLLNSRSLALTGIFMIPLLVGLKIGSRSFFKTDPGTFKKRVLILLFLMAFATLMRTIFSSLEY